MYTHEKLSILMPVYNEEATLREIVQRVLRVSWPVPIELIIVDDASHDASWQIMQDLRDAHPDSVRIYRHEQNQGKGAAVQTALRHARGSILVIQDADLEYFPEDMLQMLYTLLNTRARVVYGSRYLIPLRESYWLYYFGNRFLTMLARILYLQRITDLLTCYKMFRREAIEGLILREKGFGFDPEVSAKVMRRGYTIYEVPIKYKGRTFKEGKKVRVRDGIRTALILLWLRVQPRSRFETKLEEGGVINKR